MTEYKIIKNKKYSIRTLEMGYITFVRGGDP